MVGLVEIPIPVDFENRNEEVLRSYFQDSVNDITCGFRDALDLACDQRNKHAILESVTIRHVSIVGGSIVIHYHVELSEFQACKDVMSDYSYERIVTGRQYGSVWRFEKFTPMPERSTHDEF